MPSPVGDDSWLSALTVPLILGACVAFVVVMGTGPTEPSRPPPRSHRKRTPKSRKREKERKDSLSDWEMIPVSRNIPTEIIEHIIDFLQDDKPTLKACALAGRAWISRARHHLHSTITIKRGGPDPYKLWLLPAVARCVRRVNVRDGLWDELNRSVLVELGYIEQLRLRSSHEETYPTLPIAEFPKFPGLVELRLHNISFSSRQELYTVLKRLAKLSTLHIDLTPMNYVNQLPQGDSQPETAPFARPTFSLPLAQVHLSVRSRPGSVAQDILAIAGSSLKELSVAIVTLSSTLHSTLRTVTDLGLRHNTSLETFSLHFLWGDPLWHAPSQRLEQDKHIASSMLACIRSPCLHTLHFRIVAPLEDDPERWLRFLDVRFLDGFARPPSNVMLGVEESERALARSKGLQKVKLELRFMGELLAWMYVGVRRHIEGQLPELRRRKMLEISFSRS